MYMHVYTLMSDEKGRKKQGQTNNKTVHVPDVKNVCSTNSRSVDVVARFVKEDFEVTDDGVGSLPASAHSTGLRDLDPALTGCAYPVVYVNAEWQLG